MARAKTARQIAASRKNIKKAIAASARKRRGTGKKISRAYRSKVSAKRRRQIGTVAEVAFVAGAAYAGNKYGRKVGVKAAMSNHNKMMNSGRVNSTAKSFLVGAAMSDTIGFHGDIGAFTAGYGASGVAKLIRTKGKSRKGIVKRAAKITVRNVGISAAYHPFGAAGAIAYYGGAGHRGVRNVGAYGRGFKQGFSQSRARQKRAAWNGMQYAQGTTISRDFGPRVSSQLALPVGKGSVYNSRGRRRTRGY